MENGKKTRYFKYAFGEIILVVVGILIALQINNWNQNRLNAKKERGILTNIHNEFKQNKIQFDSVFKMHKKSHRACREIIDLFPIKSKPGKNVLDSLSLNLWDSYGGITFNPSQSSIHALTSTSGFEIISNEELRHYLISWNDLIRDYQEEELASRAYTWNQYDPFMSKHFDFYFDFEDPRVNFEAVKSLEFEFKVKAQHDLIDQILNSSGELQKVQKALDEIIRLSKTESIQ